MKTDENYFLIYVNYPVINNKEKHIEFFNNQNSVTDVWGINIIVGYLQQKFDRFSGGRSSRDKHTRAEPVAAQYEQGRIHHVGSFNALEDEMCLWLPGDHSPNRMDALVWALTDLMLGSSIDWVRFLGE